MKNFFLWLSGASTTVLLKCPSSEQKKFARLGATVLIPSTVGFFSFIYLAYTVSHNIIISVSISFIWALVILSIDIALLSSYRTNLSIFNKLIQVTLRLGIAILFGIMISHPTILLLFKDSIKGEIDKDRDMRIEEEWSKIKPYKEDLLKEIDSTRSLIIGLDEQKKSVSTGEYESSSSKSSDPTIPDLKIYQDQIYSIDNNIKVLEDKKKLEESNLSSLQTEFADEISGTGGSKRAGKGPIANSIEERIRTKTSEIQDIMTKIHSAETQKDRLNKLIIDTIQTSKNSRAKSANTERLKKKNERAYLITTIEQQRSIYRKKISDLEKQLRTYDSKFSQFKSREESNQYTDILSQTLALHRIFTSQASYIPVVLYILLITLFTLIDTIPIILKFFTKPGSYDAYINAEEKQFEATATSIRNINGYSMVIKEVKDFVSIIQASVQDFEASIANIEPHPEKGDGHDHTEIRNSLNSQKTELIKSIVNLFYKGQIKIMNEFFDIHTHHENTHKTDYRKSPQSLDDEYIHISTPTFNHIDPNNITIREQ